MGRDRFKVPVAGSRGGPMYVVAGLPPQIHNRVVGELQDRFPLAQVLGQPSASSGKRLYPEEFCQSLAKAVTDFAVRRRQREKRPLAPRYILLLFVPALDAERLLRSFDFTVMPAPLAALQARDERGRQLRHSLDAVRAALADAVESNSQVRASMNIVAERIARLSDNEVLLLPPRNFLRASGNLEEIFRAFRRGERAWTDKGAEFGPAELTQRDIPRIAGDRTRRPFIDVRNIAYLTAHPTAFHAPAREVEEGTAQETRMSLLRALYRFGAPLESGFHHDAQHSDGSPLVDRGFECSEKGPVSVSGPYANIYPNDFIRVPSKGKIKRRDLNA